MYIYPWTMNRYGEPTFHPGIKGSHRIWSTCLIDVITHTVALCTRSQWQIYNGDQTRKTALLVLTFGLCFLTSYPVLQQSDYCLISFNKSTPMWIYGPLSLYIVPHEKEFHALKESIRSNLFFSLLGKLVNLLCISFFSSIKVVELDKTVLLLLKHDNENLVNEVSIKIHPFFGGSSIQWEKIIYLPSIDVEKKSTFNF